MNRSHSILSILGGALLCSPAALAQDVITLQHTVRLAPDTTIVRLRDVATITGTSAAELSELVLTPNIATEPAPDGWTIFNTDRIRDAISTRKDVDWGSIVIQGQSASVRRMEAHAAPASAPTAADAAPAPDSIRVLVARKIAQILAVSPDDLRLKFEAADAAVLDRSATGMILDIQAAGSGDRMPLTVRGYRDQTLVVNSCVRVAVEVRRRVAVASTALDRDEIVSEGTFTIESRWVGPGLRWLDPDHAAGQAVRARLQPGEVIKSDDVQSPVAVQRGELVSIHCVSGTFVLRMTCRALEDAREGELTRFETLEPDRKARRTVMARMSGPGVAVAVSGESGPPAKRPHKGGS